MSHLHDVLQLRVRYSETDQVPVPAPGTGFYVRVQAAVTAGLSLRSGPGTTSAVVTTEGPGILLRCLEPDSVAQAKVGIQDQWLQVSDPGGLQGYVAAWYVEKAGGSSPTPAPTSVPTPTPAPAALLVFVSQSIGSVGLRLRDQPDTNSNTVAILTAGAELTVLEPVAQALPKIGQTNQWLNVQDASGASGYVAAWFVELQSTSSPVPPPQPPPQPAPAPGGLVVLVSSQASAGLRMRDQPNANGNILKILNPGTPLTVLEPAGSAKAKIGVNNQWLNVKEPGGVTGYVAAWYVTQ